MRLVFFALKIGCPGVFWRLELWLCSIQTLSIHSTNWFRGFFLLSVLYSSTVGNLAFRFWEQYHWVAIMDYEGNALCLLDWHCAVLFRAIALGRFPFRRAVQWKLSKVKVSFSPHTYNSVGSFCKLFKFAFCSWFHRLSIIGKSIPSAHGERECPPTKTRVDLFGSQFSFRAYSLSPQWINPISQVFKRWSSRRRHRGREAE